MYLRVQAFASDKVLKAINETWWKGNEKNETETLTFFGWL